MPPQCLGTATADDRQWLVHENDSFRESSGWRRAASRPIVTISDTMHASPVRQVRNPADLPFLGLRYRPVIAILRPSVSDSFLVSRLLEAGLCHV